MSSPLDQQHAPAVSSERQPGWRRRRARFRLLAWLLGPVVLVALLFQLQPGHIVLSIPVPKHLGGVDFWWESQTAELAYADEAGVLFLHRQVGSSDPLAHGWKTVEDAFAYFERWLTAHGWVPAGRGLSDTPVLPESRFLGEGNFRYYRRASSSNERAVLAIWPRPTGSDRFNVALVTQRPSWLRRLSRGFD